MVENGDLHRRGSSSILQTKPAFMDPMFLCIVAQPVSMVSYVQLQFTPTGNQILTLEH